MKRVLVMFVLVLLVGTGGPTEIQAQEAKRLKVYPSEKELEAKLAANPDDLEARYALAQRHAAARRYRDAMEGLLSVIRKDKNWRDGEAHKQLLNLFTLAADQPDLVSHYRRKLATALY